jgi:hypothetical protein
MCLPPPNVNASEQTGTESTRGAYEGLRLNRSRSSLSPELNAPKHSRGPGSTGSGGFGLGLTLKDQRDVHSSLQLSWEHRDWEKEREDALQHLSGHDLALGILHSGGMGGGLTEARDSPSDLVGRETINRSGCMRRVTAATTTYHPTSSSCVLHDSESTETLHGRYKPSLSPISHTTATTSCSGTGTGSGSGSGAAEKEPPNTTLGRSCTLPPLSIPNPHLTHPSETPYHIKCDAPKMPPRPSPRLQV